MLGVVHNKVDAALDMTKLSENAVYDIDESEYVDKAELLLVVPGCRRERLVQVFVLRHIPIHAALGVFMHRIPVYGARGFSLSGIDVRTLIDPAVHFGAADCRDGALDARLLIRESTTRRFKGRGTRLCAFLSHVSPAVVFVAPSRGRGAIKRLLK